ncbi:hypothetical protein DVH05_005042 [Phytophthora capsici]|nr:hypothetical protein DVH05_021694 [Phytophthora capsici]KAG1705017.1 hypothetical protein DVH05_005042 [Phytophthora capsici]
MATAGSTGPDTVHLLDPSIDMGLTSIEAVADMELMGVTNRDMFLWLLFNLEK